MGFVNGGWQIPHICARVFVTMFAKSALGNTKGELQYGGCVKHFSSIIARPVPHAVMTVHDGNAGDDADDEEEF